MFRSSITFYLLSATYNSNTSRFVLSARMKLNLQHYLPEKNINTKMQLFCVITQKEQRYNNAIKTFWNITMVLKAYTL